MYSVFSIAMAEDKVAFAIFLEKGAFGSLRPRYMLGGKPISPFSTFVPPEFRHVARKSIGYGSVEAEFLQVFQGRKIDYPIYINGPQGRLALKWDPDFKLEKKIALHAVADHIEIKRVGAIDGKIYGRLLLLGQLFVADLNSMRLGYFVDSAGWEAFPDSSKNLNFQPLDHSTIISVSEFNALPIAFDPKHCIVDRAEPMEATYQIAVQPGRHDKAVLHPEIECDGIMILPRSEISEFLFKAKPKKPKEVDSFFEWFEAHKYEERLFYINSSWRLVKMDGDKEMLLFTLPYHSFGRDYVDGIPLKLFFDRLDDFHAELAKQHIRLTFHKKPIEVVRWQVVLNTRSGIDWFEVNPQVFFANQELTREEWEAALTGDGFIEKDGKVFILDPKTRQALMNIAGMMKESQKGKPKQQNIVQIPRLEILDWLWMKKEGVQLKLSPTDAAIFDRLLGFHELEKRTLPSGLKGQLRDYQKEGLDWLAFLYESRLGACLADDMGLGKTIQAIAFLAWVSERKKKSVHLIVVPPSLIFNWRQEIERFFPKFRITEYAGSVRRPVFSDSDVVITTYDLVRRDIESLSKAHFQVIIFDEAQVVKNMVAGRTHAARKLQGEFKLCLTGTPFENHLGEYYSIIDLAVPGLLGQYKDFQGLLREEGHVHRLIQRTKPFVLRRSKTRILAELPAKTESDVFLMLTDHQKKLYATVVEEVRRTIDQAFSKYTLNKARLIALTAILRLRQICVSPALLDPKLKEPSPKIVYLLEKVQELLSEGHSALIFSQFTTFLDVLGPHLKKAKIPFHRLDGKTPVPRRKALVAGFQASDKPSVFLISLKTGGFGLNLTRASYVFHLDPWWNPAVENQASDRAHRIGQTQKVMVIRLLMHGTIEEKMIELKRRKQMLFEAVVDSGLERKQLVSLSKSDIEYLLYMQV